MTNTLKNCNRAVTDYATTRNLRVVSNPDDPYERVIPSAIRRGLRGYWGLNRPGEWFFYHPSPPFGYHQSMSKSGGKDLSGDQEAYFVFDVGPGEVGDLPVWARPKVSCA